MSEAVVGDCLFGRDWFGRMRHEIVAQDLCRLRSRSRDERSRFHGTACLGR